MTEPAPAPAGFTPAPPLQTQRAGPCALKFAAAPWRPWSFCFDHPEDEVKEMMKDKIVDFIIEFMEDVDKEIKDMKTVVGSDKELKIYISPGGEEHIAWDNWAQKDIKTKTKKPYD